MSKPFLEEFPSAGLDLEGWDAGVMENCSWGQYWMTRWLLDVHGNEQDIALLLKSAGLEVKGKLPSQSVNYFLKVLPCLY